MSARDFALDLGQQQAPWPPPAHARDALQLLDVLGVQLVELVGALVERALALAERLIALLDLLHAPVELGSAALLAFLFSPRSRPAGGRPRPRPRRAVCSASSRALSSISRALPCAAANDPVGFRLPALVLPLHLQLSYEVADDARRLPARSQSPGWSMLYSRYPLTFVPDLCLAPPTRGAPPRGSFPSQIPAGASWPPTRRWKSSSAQARTPAGEALRCPIGGLGFVRSRRLPGRSTSSATPFRRSSARSATCRRAAGRRPGSRPRPRRRRHRPPDPLRLQVLQHRLLYLRAPPRARSQPWRSSVLGPRPPADQPQGLTAASPPRCASPSLQLALASGSSRCPTCSPPATESETVNAHCGRRGRHARAGALCDPLSAP